MSMLRWLLTPPLRWYLRRKYRVRVHGYAPRGREPLIFISNHPHIMDTVLYKCFLSREVFVCGARPRYFSNAWKRFLMRLGKVRKVTTEAAYLADCQQLLAQGHRLLIYPELGRHKALGPFRDWAAKVALVAGVPVVPLSIRSTAEARHDGIEIRIGTPVDPNGFAGPSDLTAHFRTQIEALS